MRDHTKCTRRLKNNVNVAPPLLPPSADRPRYIMLVNMLKNANKHLHHKSKSKHPNMDATEKRNVHHDQTKTFVQIDNSQFLGIITAVIAVLITLVIFTLWRYKRTARRGVLILGLCDSGKTLIFSRLLHNKFVQTQTSVKENTGDYVVKSGSLRIIDIPGHERLRGKFFDQYKTVARGIVYVIDSVTFQKDIRDVAEFLYNIISDSMIASICPPLIILCNKQDQTLAKGSKVVQNLLEKEINLLRVTKSSQLESTNETHNNNTFLGKNGKDFQFSHLYPIQVEFAESAALNKDTKNEADFDYFKQWLAKL